MTEEQKKDFAVPVERIEEMLRQLIESSTMKGAALIMGHTLYDLDTAYGRITVGIPIEAMYAWLAAEQ